MGKYDPLGQFLRAQNSDVIPMTFAQIERVIGMKLPHSQYNRAWWSNNRNNNVMTGVWLDAHYISSDVDIKGRKLVFRRIGSDIPVSDSEREHAKKWYSKSTKDGEPTSRAAVSNRHPLIGAMKGTVWIAPGTDLTQPAMPEWGEVTYGNKTWDDFK